MDLDAYAPKERYSGKAAAYRAGRPGYPPPAVAALCEDAGWQAGSTVADIGSGTGILTAALLDRGAAVLAVEPNAAMRAEAERDLGGRPGFRSVAAAAEETGLPDGSVDGIACGQSFHWFDPARAVAEFRRLLRPDGAVGLLWNELAPLPDQEGFGTGADATAFLAAYDRLLAGHCPDYRTFGVGGVTADRVSVAAAFGGAPVTERRFGHVQHLDLDGLTSRVRSLSYAPPAGTAAHDALTEAVAGLFAAHARDGRVALPYETLVLVVRPGPAPKGPHGPRDLRRPHPTAENERPAMEPTPRPDPGATSRPSGTSGAAGPPEAAGTSGPSHASGPGAASRRTGTSPVGPSGLVQHVPKPADGEGRGRATADGALLGAHMPVRAWAARTPDAPAVAYGDRRVTYRELVSGAERVAAALRRRGVGRGTLVGVCVERSPDMVTAVLGVLHSGAAYLPLDPAAPDARLRHVLDEARVPLVLTGAATHDRTSALGVTALPVAEALAEPLAEALPAQPDPAGPSDTARTAGPADPSDTAGPAASGPAAAGPDELAYVVYTSGSTGRPKGVAMTHRPLANLLDWQLASTARHLRGRAVRTVQFTPLTFDVSFLEIFSALAAGGTVVVADDAELKDPVALLDLLVRQRATGLFLPLVALQQIADTAVRRGVFPPELGEVMTGGEQLTVTASVADWFRGMPWCTLQNIYGPSEAHVVTTHDLTGDPGGWPALPPIGTPIPGARIRLLDAGLRPVPDGRPGEVCVSGVCLARGYLGRPDLTAERFVTGPDGERLYRTGDLAVALPDGTLQYQGRLDDQVKIQGVRVEPAEIEAALNRHPDVECCAVTAREGVTGGARLVAYVVPREAAAHGMPEPVTRRHEPRFHRHLSAELPAALVPSVYVLLPALPLTTSGKVDRRALPAPSTARPPLDTAYAPPRPGTETALATMWRDLLQLDEIGADDGFFALGGNSLLVVALQGRIAQSLDVQLELATLMRFPTVRTLAAHLDAARGVTGPGAGGPAPGEPAQDAATGRAARRAAFRSGGRARRAGEGGAR